MSILNHIKWHEHANKFVERFTELCVGAVGAVFGHWLTTKKDERNQVVVDKEGKPVQTFDLKTLRSQAPHFSKTEADEAKFNRLLIELSFTLQLYLAVWMDKLGSHQRADVLLTFVEMTCQDGKEAETPEERAILWASAVKALTQLAELADPAEMSRHAHAFRLCKATEDEYLGAKFTEVVQEQLRALIQEFQKAVVLGNQHFDALDRLERRKLSRNNQRDWKRTRRVIGIVTSPVTAIIEGLDFNPFEDK